MGRGNIYPSMLVFQWKVKHLHEESTSDLGVLDDTSSFNFNCGEGGRVPRYRKSNFGPGPGAHQSINKCRPQASSTLAAGEDKLRWHRHFGELEL